MKGDEHLAERNILAWCGWQMKLEPGWRPLRITGGWQRGSMVVGDEEAPVLQVKWLRVDREGLDFEKWARRRSRSLKVTNFKQAPTPAGFTAAAAAPDVRGFEDAADLTSVWLGFSRPACLALQVVTNLDAAKKARRFVSREALPGLTAFPPGSPIRWSVFGGSFESPAGYRLSLNRLLLGDMALLFDNGKNRLMLRQVYPASIALVRRPLETWMQTRAFKEYRRYRQIGPVEHAEVECFSRRIEAIKCAGAKQARWPLHAISPRETITFAAKDAELDRILIVEHDSPKRPDESVVHQAFASMNWAMLEQRDG